MLLFEVVVVVSTGAGMSSFAPVWPLCPGSRLMPRPLFRNIELWRIEFPSPETTVTPSIPLKAMVSPMLVAVPPTVFREAPLIRTPEPPLARLVVAPALVPMNEFWIRFSSAFGPAMWTPLPVFPPMMLRAPVAVAPTVLFGELSMKMPSPPLAAAVRPSGRTPMMLPRTWFPPLPCSTIPLPEFPEMTLRAAVVDPPMRLFDEF